MLADPLTVVAALGINDAAYLASATVDSTGFACISRNDTNSTYRKLYSSTNWIDIFIGHTFGKRNRYVIRITETELVPNPVDTSVNVQKSTSYTVTCDQSTLGAATHQADILSYLNGLIRKTTDVNGIVYRVLNGET